MPAPTSYTETTLAQLMVDELGQVGAALGLIATSPQITGAVTIVERLLGLSDVATATDMDLVESAARWQAWEAAAKAAAGKVDLKADDGSQLWLSQMRAGIEDRRKLAKTAYDTVSARANGTSGGFGFAFGLARGCRGR